MLLTNSQMTPISSIRSGFNYEYGVDSSRRLTYLVLKPQGMNIQPIIIPNRFSYITKAFDFAGPIVGFYIGAPAITNSLLNGDDLVTTQDQEQNPLSSDQILMRSIIAREFSYLNEDEVSDLTDRALNSNGAQLKVLDFWAQFGDEKKADLRSKMMYMPRYAVEEMIWEMIRPGFVSIDSGDNVVYTQTSEYLRKNYSLTSAAINDISAAIIISNMLNLFNEANIEALSKYKIADPYIWENQKSQGYQKRNIDKDLSKAVFNILSPEAVKSLADHDSMIRSFEKRIESLPQMRDKALQLQRDTALSGFLAQENFEELNLLLHYYESLPEAYKQAIRET